jgi:hypothetical protein
MNVAPFDSSSPPDLRIIFENFGLTFYYAQLLEDDLKLILGAAEFLGVATFDRKKHLGIKSDDVELLKACLGSLKEALKANRKATDDDLFYDALDEANAARRLIAHRFFVEHALDLLSEAGRAAVNQHLSKLYLTIRQARTISVAVRNKLFSEAGFTPEMAEQKLAELKQTIDESIDGR